MSASDLELTEKNFESTIKKGVTVVDFWAVWCGPCQIMAPVFEDAAKLLKGKVQFGKVNVDNETDLAQQYQVMSIPTMIVFKDGEQVDRAVGVLPKDALLKMIDRHLK